MTKGGKNANGEGSIRQRPDGRYEGRTWVYTTDGRRVRRSVYGKTRDEVHEELTKLKADAIAGIRLPGTRQTVTEYLDYWLREVARERVRENTLASYEWLAARYVTPYLGTKQLRKLQPPDVRTFLNRLKRICQCCAFGKDAARHERYEAAREAKDGTRRDRKWRVVPPPRCCALKPRKCCEAYLSDGSIRLVHRMLRAAFQDAVTDGLLPQNPAKSLRLNHKYRPKFTTWTGEEAQRFLKAAREHRLHALYAVALALGLRRGEALALRWQDVDLEDGLISVTRSLQRIRGQLRFGPVKTNGSERVVAVPEHLLEILKRHRDQQRQEREQAGKTLRASDLVFATKLGTPLEPRNVNRHFIALCTRAGVPVIRFHDLRHSCATLLYEQGVPLENIQDVLGHSSPVITKTIYVEVTRKVQRGAVDQLGYLFDE